MEEDNIGTKTLKAILDRRGEEGEEGGGEGSTPAKVDPVCGSEENIAHVTKKEIPEGTCEECEDTPAIWSCEVCAGFFCQMCYDNLHRKGKRKAHSITRIEGKASEMQDDDNKSSNTKNRLSYSEGMAMPSQNKGLLEPSTYAPMIIQTPMRERAKYIPLRLSWEERRFLRLIEACLHVCDYTERVDKVFKSKNQRFHAKLRNIVAVLSGIVTSCDFDVGRKVVTDRNFIEHERLFHKAFEIARRYKIMNPEKMRTEFGKLEFLLQDSTSPDVKSMLEFSCSAKLRTVYRLLERHNMLAMLDDPNIETATQEILPDKNKSRGQIQQEIKRKERAIEYFAKTYSSGRLAPDDVRLCLYSICDNNSFLNSNRNPIDKMIDLLKTYFSPDTYKEGYSLAIIEGQEGARLTHNHERQYNFALQSLTLWREITHDMFRLWILAEEDLLSDSHLYELKQTGQGLNRVQECPRTFKAMQEILYHTQKKVGNWVGSSVIHLGDNNVPNAFLFIDKYTQVPRILSPIINCLEQVERMYDEDSSINDLVKHNFGDFKSLRHNILYDFFKCAFDGSGGDNFFEAGSCIAGRLTSAWNWCAQLPEKDFYPFFKLAGFVGFDGDLSK